MLLLDKKINKEINARTVFQRLAQLDKTAVEDCIDIYGNLIWALAKSKTNSLEEAETLTLEIFQDIWKYAKRFDLNKCDEITFISVIAHRRSTIH
ncbi:hypothetical protein BH10ACI1_BH10ACI1_05050 [soil metagenome]|jgi:RNA polymerase sigma-70 factor (ECF subfamily)